MRADLYDEIVTIKIDANSQRAVSFNQKSQFGRLSEDKLELSLIEACYLFESGRIDIYENDEKCEVSGVQGLEEQRIHNQDRFQVRF